jgi:hypothetical protein
MLVRRRDFPSNDVWQVVRVAPHNVREAWIVRREGGTEQLVGLRNLEEVDAAVEESAPEEAAEAAAVEEAAEAAAVEESAPEEAVEAARSRALEEAAEAAAAEESAPEDTEEEEEEASAPASNERASATSERIVAAPDCASVLGLTTASIDASDDPLDLIARKLRSLARQNLEAAAHDRAVGAAEWLSEHLRPRWHRVGFEDQIEVRCTPPSELYSDEEVWLPGVKKGGGYVEVRSRTRGDEIDSLGTFKLPAARLRPSGPWGRAVSWKRLATGRVVVLDRPDGYRRGDRVFLHDKRTGAYDAALVWRQTATRNLYDVVLDANAAGSRDVDECMRKEVRDCELSPTDGAPPADDEAPPPPEERARRAAPEGGDRKRQKTVVSYGPSDLNATYRSQWMESRTGSMMSRDLLKDFEKLKREAAGREAFRTQLEQLAGCQKQAPEAMKPLVEERMAELYGKITWSDPARGLVVCLLCGGMGACVYAMYGVGLKIARVINWEIDRLARAPLEKFCRAKGIEYESPMPSAARARREEAPGAAVPVEGNVCRLTAADVPADVDVLSSTGPCQDLSRANARREGYSGANATPHFANSAFLWRAAARRAPGNAGSFDRPRRQALRENPKLQILCENVIKEGETQARARRRSSSAFFWQSSCFVGQGHFPLRGPAPRARAHAARPLPQPAAVAPLELPARGPRGARLRDVPGAPRRPPRAGRLRGARAAAALFPRGLPAARRGEAPRRRRHDARRRPRGGAPGHGLPGGLVRRPRPRRARRLAHPRQLGARAAPRALLREPARRLRRAPRRRRRRGAPPGHRRRPRPRQGGLRLLAARKPRPPRRGPRRFTLSSHRSGAPSQLELHFESRGGGLDGSSLVRRSGAPSQLELQAA